MTGEVLTALASGTTVVTANNRQSRTARLAYDQAQAGAGLQVWPTARVMPWDAWLRSLWDLAVLPVEAVSRRRLLTSTQVRLAWQELMPATEAVVGGKAAVAAARRAVAAWNTCQAWGIAEETLRRESDSRDSGIFLDWLAAFRSRCAEQGWVDPGGLAGLITGFLAQGAVRPPAASFAFTGFEFFDPQQEALLQALAAAGYGVQRTGLARKPSTDVLAVPCGTPEEELNRAAGWARRHKERQPLARVAIVVPDLSGRSEDVRRACLDVLAPDWRRHPPHDSPVNVSYGMTLGESGAVQIALLVLSLLRGPIDYRDAGQILRSRFLGDIATDGAARAAADLAVRARIGRQIHAAGLATLVGESGSALATALRTVAGRTCNPFDRRQPSTWARQFSSLLANFGWPGTGRIGSELHQLLDSWQSALDSLASGDGLVGEITCGTALGHLRQICDEAIFQPAGLPHAIEVLGVLEALGRDFDALWITGLSAGRWPPQARPDALLPLGLQRRLGIPGVTPASAREQAWGRWQDLLQSAPEVRVSWAAHEGDEVATPSPFLAGIAISAGKDPALAASPGAVLAQQQARPELLEAEDPAPPASGSRLPGGTRLLALQARCPARAFFEVRLGAREIVTPPPGIVPEIRGKIVHAVLAGFFHDVHSSADLRSRSSGECRRRVGQLLDGELRLLSGDSGPFLDVLIATERELLSSRILTHIEAERSREHWEIVTVESEREAELGTFRVRVRPDRVDRLAGGSLLVIDYKTGSFSPSGWTGLRPKEPQLPLYADLLDAGAIAAVCIRRDGVRWHTLGEPGIDLPGSARTREKNTDWLTRRADWRHAILRLAGEIRQGDCRINRWDRELAEGEWALVTRVHEVALDDGEDDEEPS